MLIKHHGNEVPAGYLWKKMIYFHRTHGIIEVDTTLTELFPIFSVGRHMHQNSKS